MYHFWRMYYQVSYIIKIKFGNDSFPKQIFKSIKGFKTLDSYLQSLSQMYSI